MCPGKPRGWVMKEWDGSGLPNTGWVSTTLAAWKHLMARKLAGRLNLPLALFCDAEERYLALPGFDQSSCCAGIVLFYHFNFPVFICFSLWGQLFIMGPAERKSTTKHKLRDGEWFIASSAALLFPRRSWTQEKFTPPLLQCEIQDPAGPQSNTIGWAFWVFYSCLIGKQTTSLDDKYRLNSDIYNFWYKMCCMKYNKIM